MTEPEDITCNWCVDCHLYEDCYIDGVPVLFTEACYNGPIKEAKIR